MAKQTKGESMTILDMTFADLFEIGTACLMGLALAWCVAEACCD